jgi:hypothetical protein
MRPYAETLAELRTTRERNAITDDVRDDGEAAILSPTNRPAQPSASDDPTAGLSDRDLDAIFAAEADEPRMLDFFSVKTHEEGLKAWNEYLASKRR